MCRCKNTKKKVDRDIDLIICRCKDKKKKVDRDRDRNEKSEIKTLPLSLDAYIVKHHHLIPDLHLSCILPF